MNSTVSVFIGSSFHLMDYRKCIGNRIRQLNDVWEPKGVRIYLKQWEDFKVQYTGKSKQLEYIDELVLPSDICVFFFSDRIGMFTERELDTRLNAKKGGVYCYRVPGRKGKLWQSIVDELQAKELTAIDAMNPIDFADDVCSKIDRYITSSNMGNGNTVSSMEAKWLYTTIPDDNKDKRDEFGTTVRDVDDMSERFLGIRCKLHEEHKMNLLGQTDHYVAYCKEMTSTGDLEEMKRALELLDEKKKLKDITFFVTPKSSIFKTNAEVKELLEARELFTCTVRGADTIRWKLFTWLMREKQMLMSMATPGISMTANHLCWDGSPIVSMATLDPSGSAQSLAMKRDVILKRMNAKGTSDIMRMKLMAEKGEIEAKLWLRVSTCVNQWILSEAEQKAQAGLKQGDFEDVGLASRVAETQIEAAEEQKQAAIHTLIRLVGQLNTQIKSEEETFRKSGTADKMKSLLEQKEDVLRKLVRAGAAEPQHLLGTQLYLVGLHDTYLHPHRYTEEEDELYLRIISDADSFHILDMNVERMRMNYGNSFNRKEQYSEAMKYYRKAEENIECIENEGWLLQRIRTYVYNIIFHTYRERGDKEQMERSLQKMKKHVDHCMGLSEMFLVDKAVYMAALLTTDSVRTAGNDQAIREAFDVFREVCKKVKMPTNDQWYADIFCFFPNQIAGYLIDHLQDYRREDLHVICQHALHHLQVAMNNAKALERANLADGLWHQAEIAHQMGFLYYNMALSLWHRAEDCYMTSLKCRKRLVNMRNSFELEASYAQTLVNLGAVQVSMLERTCDTGTEDIVPRYDPEKIATEAVNLYKKHLNKESVNSELHYYQAKQLLGTAYYYTGQLKHDQELISKAIPLFEECWAWNLAHPGNSYEQEFQNYSGRILQEQSNRGC